MVIAADIDPLMGATAGVRLESWSPVPQPDPDLFAKFTVFEFRPGTWEINGSSGPHSIHGTLAAPAGTDTVTQLQITDEPLPALTPPPAA